MRIRPAIMLAALISALVLACSDDAKRPTEDSLRATEAVSVMESVRKAYVTKNFSGMSRFCSDEVYEGITKSLKSFASVELEFSPRWMEVSRDGNGIMARVSWSGTWVPTGTLTEAGTPITREGTVVFRLEGKPLKIIAIERQSPFAQP